MEAVEIREARRTLGMTQGRLARALGVARNTVTRWETGLHRPHPCALAAVRLMLALHAAGLTGIRLRRFLAELSSSAVGAA